jgi:DNA-directed RNA polymerase specialized sigma24 family protein
MIDYVTNVKEAIKKAYPRLLKEMLWVTKSKQMAEDMSQDTCVKVLLMDESNWKKVESAKFAQWLIIVGKRTYFDYLNKPSEKVKTISIDGTNMLNKEKEQGVRHMAHNLKADNVVIYTGEMFREHGDPRKQMIQIALHCLEPQLRNIIQLKMRGFDNGEICLIENLGYTSVADKFYRGCRKLREIVSRLD